MAITTALSWSILAIGLKYALNFATTGTIVWFRMAVAFLILLIFFSLQQRKSLQIFKAPPLLGVVAGLALSVNYWGYMKGIELTSASNAQVMIQIAPMSLVLIGIFYFKETPKPLQALGFLLACFGFSCFYWDQLQVSLNNRSDFLNGNLWILLAAMTWVVFASLQKVLISKWSPQQLNILIYALSTLALLPLANLAEVFSWSWPEWLLMIALGVNTLIAYGALGEALKRIPASHVSIVISANPLVTLAIMAYLTFLEVQWIGPEYVHWQGYLGALLVVTGVILTLRK